MKHSTPPPTAEDVRRFDSIREHGCIACRMRGVGNVWPEIHHLTRTGMHGGKRISHQYTIGLCPWHHRGIPLKGIYGGSSEVIAGPSLKLTPRAFRATFGRDNALLEYQNTLLLGQHRQSA